MASESITPQQCAEMIRQARCAVAFSGAGISTAAGLPDFRSEQGLYNTGHYDPDKVFDINYFHRDPSEFYRFTRDLADVAGNLQPTFTHRLLATMEAAGMLEAVITQNIDPLHHQAGSKHVVAVHGSYNTAHCLACGREFSYSQLLDMLREMEIPRCDCKARGVIKPDVVFFGEAVSEMPRAQQLCQRSDLLFVLGSSLVVYPAALLPNYAGGNVVIVNKGPVALEPGDGRYFVESDLDEFFRQVAGYLNIEISE